MSYKGYFKPRNPSKYKGDPTNIIYRSGLELRLMKFLDEQDNIIKWGSEELAIPYKSPIDGRYHRYFPDFYVKKKTVDGSIREQLIEVKPSEQCRPPRKQSKITKRYITEVKNWGINSAKWEAANEYCKDRGWKFLVWTEDHLKELGIKLLTPLKK